MSVIRPHTGMSVSLVFVDLLTAAAEEAEAGDSLDGLAHLAELVEQLVDVRAHPVQAWPGAA